MSGFEFIPSCRLSVPGTGRNFPLAPCVVTTAVAGAIGALGARLVTSVSPIHAGGLFALAAGVNAVGLVTIDLWPKDKVDEIFWPTIAATLVTSIGSLLLLCRFKVAPLSPSSGALLTIASLITTIAGLAVAIVVVEDQD